MTGDAAEADRPSRRSRRASADGDGKVPRRFSDTLRANVAAVVGAAAATALTISGLFDGSLSAAVGDGGLQKYFQLIFIPYYMIFWVAFVLVYVTFTHLVFIRPRREELVRIAAAQSRRRPTLWSRLLGYGGAGSWTVAGALVAALLTLGVAQTAAFRADPLFILLGMATVAASWFVMVYSYALHYLRLHTGGERIDFDLLEPPVFGDYLTMAFMMSTMASTLGARIRTRAGWRAAREHTVLAFAFNAVIVAMTVSLLFGGLAQ